MPTNALAVITANVGLIVPVARATRQGALGARLVRTGALAGMTVAALGAAATSNKPNYVQDGVAFNV